MIEFQKRGLPHAHILLILHPNDKPRTISDINAIVSAEIPSGALHSQAYTTVINYMMHGPCGDAYPNAPCMKDGRCSKKYPRPFASETRTETNGYPVYQRRDDGRIAPTNYRNVVWDNRWVVPHNIYFCTKYNAHINVEICTTLRVVKYLYKYVYKGHDQASMILQDENGERVVQLDEVRHFLDARYAFQIYYKMIFTYKLSY